MCLLTAWLQRPVQMRAAEQEEIRRPAAVSTIAEEELAEFEQQPEAVRKLIRSALELTRMKLTYVFASHEPERGGMDCSGTIYHLLRKTGISDVPRQSDQICRWVRDNSTLHRTDKADTLDHAAFADLRPGHLVFWSGTYTATKREMPVTHVMLYLGKNKTTGRPVVFGASDGRRYEGQRRTGVSIFDLVLPKPGAAAAVYGYGPVPGLHVNAPKSKGSGKQKLNRAP
ncbi:MAG: C40 family peptidase [Prosthecobacter sp.]|nr:C40 family peptidase [Prosthecobacter sp.]